MMAKLIFSLHVFIVQRDPLAKGGLSYLLILMEKPEGVARGTEGSALDFNISANDFIFNVSALKALGAVKSWYV